MGDWIRCEDRLPELEQRVLVFAKCIIDGFTEDAIVAITSMTDVNPLWPSIKWEVHWRDPWQYFMSDYKITHWMPLPEPPKD